MADKLAILRGLLVDLPDPFRVIVSVYRKHIPFPDQSTFKGKQR